MTLRLLKKLILVQVAILALGLHASAEMLCCASYYAQTSAADNSGFLCLDGEDSTDEAAAAFVTWARDNGVLDELAEADVLPVQSPVSQHPCDCHDNHAGSGAGLVGESEFIRLLATLPERERTPGGERVQHQFTHSALHARAPPLHRI